MVQKAHESFGVLGMVVECRNRDVDCKMCVVLTHDYLLSELLRTLHALNAIDGAEEKESEKGEEMAL